MTANPTPGGEIAAPPTLESALVNVLKLQEADTRRQQLETQLRQAPLELANLEKLIADEKAAFEAKRKAIQELEVQRKDIDNRLKSAEAQVLKFKMQQAEVRKNDEYQALSHQIETADGEVSALETEELQQMMKMDEANAQMRTAEVETKRRLAELAGQMTHVRETEAQCQANLATQTGAVEEAAALVTTVWRRAYDTAKSRAKRPPFVVPILDHRCGGCHLRMSNDVAEAARHGGKPVQCDNCGRVVYWPV
mgnify:CR=1 FL=1